MLQIQERLKARVMPIHVDRESLCREYAGFRGRPALRQEKAVDLRAEQEKLKEALLPFVREAVKKQLREEREYYRSRPSLAARQLEGVLGKGQLVPILAEQVCDRVEEQIRFQRIRRSRV